MEVIESKAAMRAWSRAHRLAGRRVALVPTMGYLHEGHLSLIRVAQQHADVIVVSIYVNPSQFAPHEDLQSYPRDLRRDMDLLKPLPVSALFTPFDLYHRPVYSLPEQTNKVAEPTTNNHESENTADVTSSSSSSSSISSAAGHESWVTVERLQRPMCGAGRPIFFRGVATVVTKLFHTVEPDVAVFGKKDYQQWKVICRMVRDLDFPVCVVGAPLMREADGLAMSSRNVRLAEGERKKALSISRALLEAKAALEEAAAAASGEAAAGSEASFPAAAPIVASVRRTIEEAGGRVEYVELVDQDTLDAVAVVSKPAVIAVAAHFGSVRLIDNVEIDIIGNS